MVGTNNSLDGVDFIPARLAPTPTAILKPSVDDDADCLPEPKHVADFLPLALPFVPNLLSPVPDCTIIATPAAEPLVPTLLAPTPVASLMPLAFAFAPCLEKLALCAAFAPLLEAFMPFLDAPILDATVPT